MARAFLLQPCHFSVVLTSLFAEADMSKHVNAACPKEKNNRKQELLRCVKAADTFRAAGCPPQASATIAEPEGN